MIEPGTGEAMRGCARKLVARRTHAGKPLPDYGEIVRDAAGDAGIGHR